MADRLTTLKLSLEKKQTELDNRFTKLFGLYHGRQGQPIQKDIASDQRLVKQSDKADQAIRNQQAEIEKTKAAIEREQNAVDRVNSVELPEAIKQLLADGVITQWRKFPNRFFVVGVDKARIVYFPETRAIAPHYHTEIKDPEQYKVFAKVFNELRSILITQ